MRVLSATHKNLAELVAQGRFREDLYYRINVIEIRVPALREHAEDIPELADAMLLQRLVQAHRRAGAAHQPARRARRCSATAFPGNVRELENILERAVALSVVGRDRRATICSCVRSCRARPPQSPPAAAGIGVRRLLRAIQRRRGPPPAHDGCPAHCRCATALGDQLENIEREAIIKALEQTRYNKTAAAKLLGMSFRALRYRVKKLGIE